MNAQIGKDGKNKFSLDNLQNKKGKYLVDFSLACQNTKYRKREEKPIPILNNAKAQLDYILMNKKWINRNLGCKAYFSYEGVSSNNRSVLVKIHLSLHRNKRQTVKPLRND